MIWYISSKTGSDASDGRTPQTAFKTLQHAVDVAVAGPAPVLPADVELDVAERRLEVG